MLKNTAFREDTVQYEWFSLINKIPRINFTLDALQLFPTWNPLPPVPLLS